MSTTERYICVHGHFYQPPRENAWLERVELQESAHPHHDWNARIERECYGPNATARILDDDERVARIVNNYASISFNFGPTLLSWLERHTPQTYQAILDADRRSAERFSGHGSAMAQVYSHPILPLCNPRDRRTQVRWGIRDFEHRFGRLPEGMWLPETAVDLASLDMLAEYGIRFTVLAPHQAHSVRPLSGGRWRGVDGDKIDTRRPWSVRLPSGREIAVFFYDGALARGVAFERLLSRGHGFADRLLSAFDDEQPGPQLVHLATDGESYGHHHLFGEMALAWALDAVERDAGARLTNYGEFLARHPPDGEARIHENTAWSCAHGLGRWSRDCGCHTGGNDDWNQRWREPLRAALDGLRDDVAPRFEKRGKAWFADPWAARDDYIDVVLDRSPANVDRFLRVHGFTSAEPSERIDALRCLELQRHAQLMYTSCGWFFDEISGIEPRQVLQYAGRVVELARQLFPGFDDQPFLETLSRARSNHPAEGSAREIYERVVIAEEADAVRVVANVAAGLLFDATLPEPPAFETRHDDPAVLEQGDIRVLTVRVQVTSRISGEQADLAVAGMHAPKYDLIGVITPYPGDEKWQGIRTALDDAFGARRPGEVRDILHALMGEENFSIDTLFRDEQSAVLDRILESTLLDVEHVYRRLHERHAPWMRRFAGLGAPPPPALRVASEWVLHSQLRKEFNQPTLRPLRIEELLEEARAEAIRLDGPSLGFAAGAALTRMARRLIEGNAGSADDAVETLLQSIAAVRRLPFPTDLREVENLVYEAPASAAIDRLADALGLAPEARKVTGS